MRVSLLERNACCLSSVVARAASRHALLLYTNIRSACCDDELERIERTPACGSARGLGGHAGAEASCSSAEQFERFGRRGAGGGKAKELELAGNGVDDSGGSAEQPERIERPAAALQREKQLPLVW